MLRVPSDKSKAKTIKHLAENINIAWFRREVKGGRREQPVDARIVG